ncbi:hypothetical protein FB451DRAFT_1167666 [Mycena latifolia]|nr:hypothetical protein FB451DRAFT_1167666 [Mycena latifolia]
MQDSKLAIWGSCLQQLVALWKPGWLQAENYPVWCISGVAEVQDGASRARGIRDECQKLGAMRHQLFGHSCPKWPNVGPCSVNLRLRYRTTRNRKRRSRGPYAQAPLKMTGCSPSRADARVLPSTHAWPGAACMCPHWRGASISVHLHGLWLPANQGRCAPHGGGAGMAAAAGPVEVAAVAAAGPLEVAAVAAEAAGEGRRQSARPGSTCFLCLAAVPVLRITVEVMLTPGAAVPGISPQNKQSPSGTI